MATKIRYAKNAQSPDQEQQAVINWDFGPVVVSASAGSGKCLTGDSLITTESGVVRLDECNETRDVRSVDIVHNELGTSNSIQFHDMGVSEIVKITTRTGIILRGTPEHPLLTWNDYAGFQWTRLDKLTVNDDVLLWPGNAIGTGTPTIDPEEAYLLGMLAGDGWQISNTKYHKGSEISWSRSKEAWARLNTLMPCHGARTKTIPAWLFKSSDAERIKFLQGYFDTDGSYSRGRCVEIVSASENLARGTQQLLLGLGVVSILSTKFVDGYDHTYWKLMISGEHARTFSDRIGFRYEKSKADALADLIDRPSNPNVGCYEVGEHLHTMINEWKELGRWNGRKSKVRCDDSDICISDYKSGRRRISKDTLIKLIKACNSPPASKLHLLTNLYPDQIVSVERCEPEHVYDLTIEKTHNFVANGIVSHNTFSVIERIARLIKDGVPARSILATTFTKKAAQEMMDRLETKGVDTREMSVRTMHSYCWSLIRGHRKFAGFEIDDKDAARIILKKIVGFSGMKWKKCDITLVEKFIADCRNALVTPENSRSFKIHDYDERYSEAYFRFSTDMYSRKLITFDDMLYYGVMLLKEDNRLLENEQGKYEYVIVDEYQDSNVAQVKLAEMISQPEMNLMVVGDVDQCIYEFRGAVPQYMLDFQKRTGGTLLELNNNYRCAPEIIYKASDLIGYNEKRFSKRVNAARKCDFSPTYFAAENEDDEASRISDHIKQLSTDGIKFNDMFVLMRTNAQSRAFEESFVQQGIPFVILGGVSFYERKEVQDLLAYIKVGLDPQDVAAGVKSITRPFRYIKKEDLDRASALVDDDVGFVDAVEQYNRKANSRGMSEYVTLMRQINFDDSPSTIMRKIVNDTRWNDRLIQEEGSDSPENSRVDNIEALIGSAARFMDCKKFVEYVNRQIRLRKAASRNEDSNRVQVSTVHRSKGLQATAVFVVGMNEGLFPHGKTTNIEEERRLFFVAMTRAKDRLFVSSLRSKNGRETPISKFVFEAKLTPDGENGSVEELAFPSEE